MIEKNKEPREYNSLKERHKRKQKIASNFKLD